MADKIFGYDWDAIQSAQQGDMSGLRRAIVERPVGYVEWSDKDQELLEKYQTADALEAAGFFGTADRAKRKTR